MTGNRQLCYTEKDGFGLILPKEYYADSLSIYTEKDQITEVRRASVISFADYCDDKETPGRFIGLPDLARARTEGKRLFQEGRVTHRPGNKGELHFLVGGEAEISFQAQYNFGQVSSCKCRSRYCRHHYAVYFYLMDRYRELRQQYVKSGNVPNKSFYLEEELENMLLKNWVPADLSPEVLKEMHQLAGRILAPDSISYVGGVLQRLFSLEPNSWGGYEAGFMALKQPLLGTLCADPTLSPVVTGEEVTKYLSSYPSRQYKGNRSFFSSLQKAFKVAEKELNKGNYEENWTKEFLLKYTASSDRLLKYLAIGKKELSFADLAYLMQMPEEAVSTLLPAEKKQLLKKIDATEGKKQTSELRTLKHCLNWLDGQDKIHVLSELQYFHPDLETYQSLPREDQLLLACSMPVQEKTVLYILEQVFKDAADQEKAAYLLYIAEKTKKREVPAGFSVRTAERILEEGTKLPHHGLLKPYLEDVLFPFAPRKISLEGSIVFDQDDLAAYFRGDFSVKPANGSAAVRYQLQPLRAAASTVAELAETSGRLNPCGSMERRFSRESVQAFVRFCAGNRQEELRRQKQEILDQVAAEKFEKEHMSFMWGYRELCKDLREEKVLLESSFKAKIQYYFDLSGRQPLLSFKVGNVRFYVVKNGNDFMEAFRKRETVTYGKDLILTHDVENLTEEDRPVIQLLSSMSFPYVSGETSSKRYLPVEGPLFVNLMRQLSGRQVFIDDVPCLIRLDPAEVKVRVDAAYRLSLPIDEKQQKLLITDDKAFLVSYRDGSAVMDQVSCSPEEARLLAFIQENQGISILPILNGFKKDIYARFSGMFDLDERVRTGFRLSVIRISAYFDYQDKAITVRCDYAKDDAPIAREKITEPMDLAKVSAFDMALASLGFENGRLADESHILSFMKMDFAGLKRLANIYLSESLNNKKLLSVSRQTIKISCGKSGIIEAVLEKSEFSEAELEEILTGLRKKKKFILLSGDRIIDLSSEEAAEFGETVRDLGLQPGALMKKKRLEMVGALKAFAHENNCSIDRQLRTIIEEIRNFKDYETKLPDLSAQLRSYQEEGYRWLSVLSKNNLGGILADDMGLGKTLQMIALIKSDRTPKPSLIVCPKSLVFNWISEFRRFDGETEVVGVYGVSSRREEIIRNIDYGKKAVYVTSYDSLRNDISLYEGSFQYAVLDEAQFIKNVAAQKSRSVKEIQALHRFALTGTPIENNIIDLWSIFEFIMPGYFEELAEFRSRAGQEGFHETLAKRIGPFVLRRVKENVLADLPQKYERILSCEMTPEQKKLYEALRQRARKSLESGGKAFDMLPQLMQMRQVCVDPAMCTENYRGQSGKMVLLEELIPRYIAEGHRLLIFSQFVKGLEQVEKLLEKNQIPYYLLTGQTSAQERARLIDEFNSTTGTDVFLISLKAGGTGLNLTGADTVIHLDPWWNAAAENQATDRAHRIGQTRNVEVIKLISEDSIEQRVIELQDMKKDLFDKVIAKDESSVTGASLEDIAFILQ